MRLLTTSWLWVGEVRVIVEEWRPVLRYPEYEVSSLGFFHALNQSCNSIR